MIINELDTTFKNSGKFIWSNQNKSSIFVSSKQLSIDLKTKKMKNLTEKKERMTGFAGTIHLTPECLNQNEQEVVSQLADDLKNKYGYVSYQNATIEERMLRAQKEYDYFFRLHFVVKRNWRFFENNTYGQRIALTKQSSEAVFCKNGKCDVRNQGSAFYVLNSYSEQWSEAGYFFGTRAEVEEILISGNFPKTEKLPPVELFFAI